MAAIKSLRAAVRRANNSAAGMRRALYRLEQVRERLNEKIVEARLAHTMAERSLALARERLQKAQEPARVPALMRKGG